MSTLVHSRGEGVKIGSKFVHVVVECPPSEKSIIYNIVGKLFISLIFLVKRSLVKFKEVLNLVKSSLVNFRTVQGGVL